MPPARSLVAATEIDIAARLRRVVGSARRASPALWASAAVLLVAAAAQARFGAVADVSWMITIGEKWLDGQTPYVDFIETNPPAAILIYMPAVVLARLIGVRAEIVVAAYGFAAAGGSLALSAAILRRAGLISGLGALALALALTALTILPGRTFDEREVFVTLLALPYLALCAARAARAPIDWRGALVAGLCLAAMAAIKPPYALIGAAVAPYLTWRIGFRNLLGAIEYHVAAAFLIAYAALTIWRFPAYGADVVPAVAAAYLPVREFGAATVGQRRRRRLGRAVGAAGGDRGASSARPSRRDAGARRDRRPGGVLRPRQGMALSGLPGARPHRRRPRRGVGGARAAAATARRRGRRGGGDRGRRLARRPAADRLRGAGGFGRLFRPHRGRAWGCVPRRASAPSASPKPPPPR